MNSKELHERKIAPKIRFQQGVNNLYVTSISFERNDLYLNDVLYNAGGISGYSRVHSKDGIIRLREISPPFILGKKRDNDTLQITKGDSIFYLLVTEEIKYAHE